MTPPDDHPHQPPVEERRLEALLRDAYRSIPVAAPDLRAPVLERLRHREQRQPGPHTAPARAAGAQPARPRSSAPGAAVRWGLRLYWLVTAVAAVALVARAGAAGPGALPLLLGALAAVSLLLGVRAVAHGTGHNTPELVVRSIRGPAV